MTIENVSPRPTHLNQGDQKSTTLSTINVSSDETKIVIALLKNEESLELKITEMKPCLIDIGMSLEQALDYQRQHDDAIKKIENIQSPAEQLLSQSDEMIASQKVNSQESSEMTQNLNTAWEALKTRLKERQKLLDQAVTFYKQCQEFSQIIDESEKKVNSINPEADKQEIASWVKRIYEHKKDILEASMLTMNQEQLLLETLKEMDENNINDNRPSYASSDMSHMIGYIQDYLEKIQEKRRQFELLLHSKRESLKILSNNSALIKGLEEVSKEIEEKDKVLSLVSPGNNLSEAQMSQKRMLDIEKELKEIGARAIKLAHEGENLLQERSEELRDLAYSTLASYTNTLSQFDKLKLLIERSVQFYESSNQCIDRLNQILQVISDNECKRKEIKKCDINAIISVMIESGKEIADELKDTKSCQGINKRVKEIEMLSNELISMLSEGSQKQSSNINDKFIGICETLSKWLQDNGTCFIQRHQNLGNSYLTANDFHEKHKSLCHQAQTKQVEVNAFLTALHRTFLPNQDIESHIKEKADQLQFAWINFNSLLEARILISQKWLSFHRSFDQILKQIVELEKDLLTSSNDNLRRAEERFVVIQQDAFKLNNACKNLIREIKEMKDPYLDKDGTVIYAEECLKQLESNGAKLKEMMEESKDKVHDDRMCERQVIREVEAVPKKADDNKDNQKDRWATLLTEIAELQVQLEAIDSKLYPLINNDINGIATILSFLTNKQALALHLITNLHSKVELLMQSVESLDCQNSQSDKFQLIDQLRGEFKALQKRQSDFKVLCLMMTNYFQLILEIQNVIDNLGQECNDSNLPTTWTEINEAVQKLELIRGKVSKLIELSRHEGEALIGKIIEIEPDDVSSFDKEKIIPIVNALSDKFLSIYDIQREKLDQQKLFFQFDQDLKSIHEQIEELSSQLKSMRGNFGSSLSTTKATSIAFRQFEKTIQLLEQKVKIFCTTSDRTLSNSTIDSNLIKQDITDLEKRWSILSSNVTENRKLIDSSVALYQIIEEGEAWIEKSSKIIGKSFYQIDNHNDPKEITKLSKEIDTLLKAQDFELDAVNNASSLSQELYGKKQVPEQLKQAINRAKEMYDLMKFMKNELSLTQEKLLHHQQQPKSQSPKLQTKSQPRQRSPTSQLYHQKHQEQKQSEMNQLQIPSKSRTSSSKLASSKPTSVVEKAASKTADLLKDLIVKDAIKETVSTKLFKIDKEFTCKPVQCPPKFLQSLVDAEIVAGEGYTFKCKLEGSPESKVTWYKDGIEISTQPGYKVTQTNLGDHILIVDKTVAQSSTFCCKAVNSVGTAVTNSHLTVKAAQIPLPVFIEGLKSADCYIGDTITFKCRVNDKSNASVSWFKDNLPIHYPHCARNNDTYILTLKPTKLDDSGTITVRASNKAGFVVSKANLRVLAKESPSFIESPNDVTIISGQPLLLECRVKGSPTPKIDWLCNNVLIKAGPETRISFQDGQSVLKITKTSSKNSGCYMAMAKNSAGKSMSSCNVIITNASIQPSNISPTMFNQKVDPIKFENKSDIHEESKSYPQLTAPIVIKPLNNASIEERQNLVLNCDIIGNPTPNVSWYCNGELVIPTPGQEMLQKGQTYSLTVYDVRSEHQGTYTVIAVNNFGQAKSQAQVCVNMELMKAPQFLKHLEDKLINQDTDALLSCTIIGNPEPKVAWYFNEKAIDYCNNDQYIFTKSECNYTLVIKNVSLGRQGKYYIVAENKMGKAVSSANVLKSGLGRSSSAVQLNQTSPTFSNLTFKQNFKESKPSSKSSLQIFESGSHQPNPAKSLGPYYIQPQVKEPLVHHLFETKKIYTNDVVIQNYQIASNRSDDVSKPIGYPKFLQTLRNICVKPGIEITLEVEVSGSPEPLVEWFCNDTPIQNGSEFKMIKIGRKHRLVINKISEANLELKAKASNFLGTIECSATVSSKHDPEVKQSNAFDSANQPCNDVLSVKQKREFFNQIAKEKESMKQRCSSLDRKVSSRNPPKPLKAYHPFYSLVKTTSNECLQPVPLNRSPSSKSDVSDQGLLETSSSDFKPFWSPKNDNVFRPRWRPVKGPSSFEAVSQNESFSLKDEDLCSSLSSTSLDTLSQCSVSSPTTSHFSQDIKPVARELSFKIRPPIFISELKDIRIKKGDRLCLECQVDGYPFPSIQWFHNGFRLLSNSGIMSSSQSIAHIRRFVIDNADYTASGIYACVATNSSGSYSTQCEVVIEQG